MNKIVNGISINTFGDKNNQPLVLLHGFPYDYNMWNSQIAYFSDKYYVIAYDIRGLGCSQQGDGQFTMELFVDDLFDVINLECEKRPIVAGLSMGGYILLNALYKDMSKFKAIILLDTKAEADDNNGKLKRAGAIKKINNDGLQSFIESFVPTCFWDENKNKEFFTETLKRCRFNTPAGVKGCTLAMVSRLDTTEFLREIDIPTLIICGKYDLLSPLDTMKKMADNIIDSKFVEISNSGHMTPIENSAEVNNAIEIFLNELNM